MILLVEHLVIYTYDISRLSLSWLWSKVETHTFDLPVTSRVLLQEVGKSVLALNIDFNFTISVLSGELEPLGDDGLHLGDRAVSFGLDCSTDSLMHDPVTVLETLFRNLDEFVNSAAARPGGKDVSIVVKQGSVLQGEFVYQHKIVFVVGHRLRLTRGHSWASRWVGQPSHISRIASRSSFCSTVPFTSKLMRWIFLASVKPKDVPKVVP